MEPRPLPALDQPVPGDVSPPAVAGHDVVRRLGRGGFGDVWLLREQRTGRLVAGKVVRRTGDAGARSVPVPMARRELRALRAAVHPHVLTCHAALPPEGARGEAIVLLSEYAAGGSLARLVGVRGRLEVGETVTAIGPIAQALAALHAQGITHLDVSPGNVLFTAQGKPLLADLGSARLVGDPTSGPASTPGFEEPAGVGTDQPEGLRPAADVHGVGAVAWFCLTGSAPGRTAERPPLTLLCEDVPPELAAAIDAALADDPRDRPTAAEFARAVFRSARPEPIDLAPAVDEEVLAELVTRMRPEDGAQGRLRGRARRARLDWLRAARPGVAAAVAGPWLLPRRWLARWCGLVLVVAAAVGVVWAFSADGVPWAARSATGTETSAREPEAWSRLPEAVRRGAESTDPVQALQALAQIRAHAITAADRGLLDRVNARGSEAAAKDAELIDRLEREGQRLDGFSSEVFSAELIAPDTDVGGGTAVVRARVVSSGFATFSASGREISAPGAGTDQTLRIVLERAAETWRVARILAA